MKKQILAKFESAIVSREMTIQLVGGKQKCCWSTGGCISCNGGTCSAGGGCLSCSGGSNDGGSSC